MRAIWLIIKREYQQRVRKRSFLILTLLGPLFFSLLLIIPAWLSLNSVKKQEVTLIFDPDEIVDDTAWEYDYGLEVLPESLSEQEAILIFLESGHHSLINLKKGIQSPEIIFHESPDMSSEIRVKHLLDELYYREKIKNIKPDLLNDRAIPSNNSSIQVLNQKENSHGARTGLSILAGILIYLFILTYTMQVLRGVTQEKSNRVMEVLITSVKPFQLMMGKILGIAMVSITQFLIWLSLAAVIIFSFESRYGESLTLFDNEHIQQTIQNDQINFNEAMEWNQLINTFGDLDLGIFSIQFAFYFIFGYLFYASLFAAIGSSVDSETETQQFVFPLTVPILLTFTLSQNIVAEPDSGISLFFSLFPFTSPVCMMILFPFSLPLWHKLLSMAVLILSFMVMTWVSGKIYRTGILMYGKKASLKEILRWLNYE